MKRLLSVLLAICLTASVIAVLPVAADAAGTQTAAIGSATDLLGDADGDGEVTILDATAIQRRLAQLKTVVFIRQAADADGDGEVTILDATAIQRYLAQLTSSFTPRKIDIESKIYDVDPADLPEGLTEFLNRFDNGYYTARGDREYDCTDLENAYDTLPLQIVGNPACLDLWTCPGGDSVFTSWPYLYAPKATVLWAMENMLNIPEDEALAMVDLSVESHPEFIEFRNDFNDNDGQLYLCNKLGGVGGPGFYISYEAIRFDGDRYYIVYDLTADISYCYANTHVFYAEAEFKEIDGVGYWSLYRHTENVPALPDPDVESDNNTFAKFAGVYTFTSGAGNWVTQMEINADGSFTGVFYDYNLGDDGEGYDRTLYYSRFSGYFMTPKKINNYTYSFLLDHISYENEPGTEEIIQDSGFRTRKIYTSAYGLDEGASLIYAYTEEAPATLVPDKLLSWISVLRGLYDRENVRLLYKCLYITEPEYGWMCVD